LTCDHLVTYYRRIGTDDDDVFKALADGGRRQLLDSLFDRDGRTLGELCDVLPAMTRFGVMKHLAVLEDAKLVVTEKAGRTKLHYLNPVPIQEIHERWISKYAAPTVAAMVGLRSQLESREPA
jgi:DNA-binding transcriptional ArsR family regulator